jgi:hypothetical protein
MSMYYRQENIYLLSRYIVRTIDNRKGRYSFPILKKSSPTEDPMANIIFGKISAKEVCANLLFKKKNIIKYF